MSISLGVKWLHLPESNPDSYRECIGVSKTSSATFTFGGARCIATRHGFATTCIYFRIPFSRFTALSICLGLIKLLYVTLMLWALFLIYFWGLRWFCCVLRHSGSTHISLHSWTLWSITGMCLFFVFPIRFRLVNLSEFLGWMSRGNSWLLDIATSHAPCSEDTWKRSLVTHWRSCRVMFLGASWWAVIFLEVIFLAVFSSLHTRSSACGSTFPWWALSKSYEAGPYSAHKWHPVVIYQVFQFAFNIVLTSCPGFPTVFDSHRCASSHGLGLEATQDYMYTNFINIQIYWQWITFQCFVKLMWENGSFKFRCNMTL